MFIFQKASDGEFDLIKDFYWNLIDSMSEQNDTIGWKKGIYPSDSFLQESLSNEELFTLRNSDRLYGCVVLNSQCNEGYADVPWTFQYRSGWIHDRTNAGKLSGNVQYVYYGLLPW